MTRLLTNRDNRPKPTLEQVALERLTFDPELQMRAELFNEATVERYLEAMQNGDEFPAIDIVRETAPLRHKPKEFSERVRLLVIDGFNRGEAWLRFGVASVPVNVFEGTYEVARFWSLNSNAKNAESRTDADARRALTTLLDTPGLFRRAKEWVYPGQDLTRSIAAAAGVSKGLIAKVLRERGLAVRKDELVPIAVPSLPTPSRNGTHPKPPTPLPARATAPEVEPDDEPQPTRKPGRPSVKQSVEMASALKSLALTEQFIHKASHHVHDLLGGPLGATLRDAADGQGIAFEVDEELAGDSRTVRIVRSVRWPALEKLLAVVSDVTGSISAEPAGKK